MKTLILLCVTTIYFVSSTKAQHTESTTDVAGETAILGQNTDVTNSSSIGVTGIGYTGVRGIGVGTNGAGVLGQSTGPIGVFGVQTLGTSINPGVLGITNSFQADVSGVRGEISSTSPGSFSAGVRGINKGTGGNGVGVYGSHAGTGWGVYGFSNGTGVRGSSDTGLGVFGTTGSTQADASGVQGEISSISPGSGSAGVRGINKGTGTSGIGVYGTHDGTGWGVYGLSNGIGVRGQSALGTGVYGIHNGIGGTAPGVHGRTSSVDAGAVAILGEITSTLSGEASIAIYGINEGLTNHGGGVLGEHMGNGDGVIGVAHGSGAGVRGIGSDFDFYAAGVGTDYGSASSRRWKKNVINIPDALAKVAQLRGVLFDWDEAHGGKPGMGFIAEEVGAVFPDIVQFEENGVDAIGLDYSKITPVLVEAINTMRAEYLRLFEEQNRLIAQQKEIITELNLKHQKSKYEAAGR
ncbi:MAG: tail fiber domain-containing protein [Saprospiraceae bacterium]|nr:tail fiber domain-containing protein [Saprospiraceae bacterium]